MMLKVNDGISDHNPVATRPPDGILGIVGRAFG
jgi:hypothetical protein